MNVTSIIFLVVIVLLFVGLFVWNHISQKKKKEQTEKMHKSLQIGDKVKTIGGVCGYLVEINYAENTFVLETGTDGHKSYVRFDLAAIYDTSSNHVEKAEIKEDKKEEVAEPAKEEAAVPAEEVKEEVKTEDKAE